MMAYAVFWKKTKICIGDTHNELLQKFSFVAADIADKGQLEQRNIDTVINAAKPALMGSDCGVDGVIHKAIDTGQQPGILLL